jgi:hypothetical protein
VPGLGGPWRSSAGNCEPTQPHDQVLRRAAADIDGEDQNPAAVRPRTDNVRHKAHRLAPRVDSRRLGTRFRARILPADEANDRPFGSRRSRWRLRNSWSLGGAGSPQWCDALARATTCVVDVDLWLAYNIQA